MRFTTTALLLFAQSPIAFAQKGLETIPATGDNGQPGGIFGPGSSFNLSSLSSIARLFGSPAASPSSSPQPSMLGSMLDWVAKLLPGGGDLASLGVFFGGAGSEFPNSTLTPEQLADPGTGRYPAGFLTDPTLPEKTIYAPKTPPPANVKMPVIVWGEGGCFKTGTFYSPFLIEIASHGYLILANGPPNGGPPQKISDLAQLLTVGQNKISDMYNSIEWALAGKGSKFGNIDTDHIIAAGQSCGGSEALSASYHNDKVKMTILVNSGTLNPRSRPLLKELKYPLAIFNGGPKDIAYENGELDYDALAKGIPAFKANLDTGHGGTLFGMNGGKFGKAVVAFLEWQFRGDPKSKATCLDPQSPGSLVSDRWNVTHKNWT